MLGKRAGVVATVVCTALFGAAAAAGPASARVVRKIALNDSVNVTTTLKTLKQTVVVPQGTFKGWIYSNYSIKGTLALPPASSTVKLGGLGLAKATFTMVQTKPVTGKINFYTFKMTTTSTFNIHVDSLDPVGTSVNLVGSSCITMQPVTLTLAGGFQDFGPSTFSGTYTIPKFAHCGVSTVLLNQLLAGPGNSITATFTPS